MLIFAQFMTVIVMPLEQFYRFLAENSLPIPGRPKRNISEAAMTHFCDKPDSIRARALGDSGDERLYRQCRGAPSFLPKWRISTVNVPIDVTGLLGTLATNGRLHVVGVVLEPMQVPAFGLIMGQKSVSGSPTGSPTDIDRMLEFSARHSIAPIIETFPMSKMNDALDHLRSGKARYRIVLANDASASL
jgi:hypothetical protein